MRFCNINNLFRCFNSFELLLEATVTFYLRYKSFQLLF